MSQSNREKGRIEPLTLSQSNREKGRISIRPYMDF
jgi:hypothetical protein